MEFTIKNYRCFEDTNPLKIEIGKEFVAFVGPNNAGKSSALRFFYEFRNLWQLLSGTEDKGLLLSLFSKIKQPLGFIGVNDQNEVFSNLNDRGVQIEIKFIEEKKSINSITKMLICISRNPISSIIDLWMGNKKIDFNNCRDVRWDQDILNFNIKGEGIYTVNFSRIFSKFAVLKNSIYIGSFRNIINIGGEDNYFDISVGTKFIKTWREWKSGPEKQKNDIIQRVQSDIQRIFKFDALEISDALELNTLQVYINGRSYKLNELGSGIAQFVIVLGNIAIKQPGFIFIDEPELHLHPSLQLQFLMALNSYSKNGIFFATHLIGLARSVAERIYSVTRDKKGRAMIHNFEETPHLSEFLGEISFRSFKDVGYDKILLVEGVNELKTIQQFLRFIHKDMKVVLLPLGGSSMINKKREFELNEIFRMSDNIFVLIDSEKKSKSASLSKDRSNFVNICKKLKMDIHVLDRRTIENYFTEEAIQKVKGDKYHTLSYYQLLKDIDPSWSKSENWKIAREMNFNDIKNTDLGEFLKKL